MRPLPSAFSSVAVVLVLCSPLAAAPGIGVFLDPDCTVCSGTATFLVPFTFYIAARLEPPVAEGIEGASFRVDGLPASWNTINWPMVCEPNPALSFISGNPISYQGTTVAFANDCSGPASCVTLFTCHVMPFATETNVRLRVRAEMTYCGGPFFCCPELIRCDPPVFTALCVPGGEAVFNGPPCTVSVERATWTQIKRLFE